MRQDKPAKRKNGFLSLSVLSLERVFTMAKSSFTNEMLVKAWKKVHAANGSRHDVVAELGLDPTKGYNNVTQRITELKKRGLALPDLSSGRGGQRVDETEIARLASILSMTEDKPADEPAQPMGAPLGVVAPMEGEAVNA